MHGTSLGVYPLLMVKGLTLGREGIFFCYQKVSMHCLCSFFKIARNYK